MLRRYDAHLGWNNYEDYAYRDGQLLAAAHTPAAPAPKTGMWHFHLDHLGTPRMVTNQNGASIGFHRYYPFGQEQTALQEGERRKFTGHERDLANLTGTADDLDYMHARHYSPLTGRFLSTDSAGANPHLPQGWNRYAYTANNPLKFIDLTGETFVLSACASGGSREECTKQKALLVQAVGKMTAQFLVVNRRTGEIGFKGTTAQEFGSLGTFQRGLATLIESRKTFSLFTGNPEKSGPGGAFTEVLKGVVRTSFSIRRAFRRSMVASHKPPPRH